MRLGTIPRTYRSLRRLRRIISVLVKYGFDDIIERLNLAGKNLLPFVRRRPELRGLTTAQRLRLVLEELGPTFIKFGQVLSTRTDLLPPEFIHELRKLQDMVAPMPQAEVRQAVESALGRTVEELFAEFDFEVKAAASIAQVHMATLPSGRPVVIKLQRPNIERVIDDDSGVLMQLAQLMERHGVGREFEPVKIVEHFRRNIKKEIDFTLEGQNMDRFRANFAGSGTFRVPEVIWSHSGRRLLTMERLEGIKVSERERLIEAGYDPQVTAARLVEAMARQVIGFGLFHADPHPGNVFVLPGNVICLLDYGLVGRVDEDLVGQIVDMAAAVLRRDGDAMVRALLNIGSVESATNLRALKLDLLELVDRYYKASLRSIDMQALFEQFMAVVRVHHVSVPSELLLLARAVVLVQAVGRDLDPAFEPLARLTPLIGELAAARMGPAYHLRRFQGYLAEVADLLRELPRESRSLLHKLQRNELAVNLQHRGLERLTDEIDRSSNRISFSLIIAALIIGSSIVLQSYSGPQVWGFPLLALLGFIGAAFLGFWLVIAIVRSGKL
jgi:ubiquinone biosynthesis protein